MMWISLFWGILLPMKLLSWNVQGLSLTHNRAQINSLISAYMPDFVILIETKLMCVSKKIIKSLWSSFSIKCNVGWLETFCQKCYWRTFFHLDKYLLLKWYKLVAFYYIRSWKKKKQKSLLKWNRGSKKQMSSTVEYSWRCFHVIRWNREISALNLAPITWRDTILLQTIVILLIHLSQMPSILYNYKSAFNFYGGGITLLKIGGTQEKCKHKSAMVVFNALTSILQL